MATRLSGRVRRLEQTRGTCAVCRGRGKVVLDQLPGCAGCGKKIRVVVEYVEAPLPH